MSEDTNTGWILLQNILTEDDIADEACMEESIEDVRELASQYGNVLSIDFDPKDLTRVVRVKYDGGNEVASFAASKFNNMVLGGQTIAATTMAQPSNTPNDTDSTLEADKSRKRPVDTAPKPLYSGDKLIPERFAEAKRVPKVVTSTGPREYASISKNEEVVPLLIEMLGELMRLQRRAIEDKNAKARRRIVMGLREVARGIRAHKVKMVVMANNVDQYGAIDDKLQEIIDLARQEDVPVIFELNKRKLGKAVGKSIKVSVVGIQNADGAHQQFKKLASLASKI
jgi:selenocysteine insertion sequence-binding protein 2